MQRLSGDALRFWGEPTWRARQLQAILAAPDAVARAHALRSVDDAVTGGMAALGFPRAPVRALHLVLPQASGDLGVKYLTCELQIGLPGLRRALGPGGFPDEVVETWIHESVHGRLFPWSPGARAEQSFRGFEEGLAEGIAGLVSRWAAFIPGVPAYGRFVQTYDVLADLLGVTPEMIYRRLYPLGNGSVMDGFVTGIDALRVEAGAQPLTIEQRGRLERAARRLFDIVYQQEPASPRARRTIRQAWRRALL